MQKKKIINFRPLFYCFISYAFAIIFAGKLFYGHFAYIILFFALLITGFLLAFYKKAFLKFSVCIIAITLGLCSFFIASNEYLNATSYDNTVTISGDIASIREYSNGQQLVLKNIQIEGVKKDFSISLIDYEALFETGDFIKFQTNLSKVTLFNLGKFSSYYYNNKIFYTATFSSSNLISHEKDNLSFKEKIKQNTLNSFLTVMPKEIAHVAYGAMFGDSSGISSETTTLFRDSGIIHILSVSGLHMLIVVGIVNFLLKKIKISSLLRLLIFSSVLIFYAYLCSFNITVLRACLMSLIFIFGTSFGKRYDMLSALGLSGLMLLLFKPLTVFDIGFQLSFLSVFMIAGFAKPVSKFFQKRGLPKKISSALAVTLSVQAGLFPLTLKYFGQFPLLGTFANLLAVPIFELGFVLAFVLNIFLMFLPFLSFLLLPISFLFSLTISISNFFASMNFLIIHSYLPSSIIILFFLITLFLASPFIMLSKTFKRAVTLSLSFLCVVFCLIDLRPAKYDNLTIFQASNSQTNSTIFITEKESVLISDFKNISFLTLYLANARINSFDIVLLVDAYNQSNFNQFKKTFNIKTVLLPEQTFESDTVMIDSFTLLSRKTLPTLNIYGYNLLILSSQLTFEEENNLNLITNFVNYNIFVNWHEAEIDFNADYVLNKNTLFSPYTSYKQLNNWYFSLKNGKIKFVRSLN